jgi:membrane protein
MTKKQTRAQLFIQRVLEPPKRWLSPFHPKGFGGVNLWEVLSFFWLSFTNVSTTIRAAGISYRIFLAFFPAAITLFTLIPYLPIADFQTDVFAYLRELLPGDTFGLVEETLKDLINKKQSTLMSVGFILMLYYSSASLNAIMQAFHASQHVHEPPHPMLVRLISFLMMFVLGFVFVLAVVLMSLSASSFETLHEKGIIGDKGIIPFLQVGQWLISIFFIHAIVSLLYNAGMSIRWRKSWKYLNTGSVFATLSFVVTSYGFGYFLDNFSRYNKLYGSLGTLMVVLIWLNINMIILLVGFDLNVFIRNHKRHKYATNEEI